MGKITRISFLTPICIDTKGYGDYYVDKEVSYAPSCQCHINHETTSRNSATASRRTDECDRLSRPMSRQLENRGEMGAAGLANGCEFGPSASPSGDHGGVSHGGSGLSSGVSRTWPGANCLGPSDGIPSGTPGTHSSNPPTGERAAVSVPTSEALVYPRRASPGSDGYSTRASHRRRDGFRRQHFGHPLRDTPEIFRNPSRFHLGHGGRRVTTCL